MKKNKPYQFKAGELYRIKELTFTMYDMTGTYLKKEGHNHVFKLKSGSYPFSEYELHEKNNKRSLYEITAIPD